MNKYEKRKQIISYVAPYISLFPTIYALVMTVRKQWPEIRRICCYGVNYFSCTEEYWWKDREFRNRVICECRKIRSYIEKQFISDISIVDGVVM